jgi:hypothetical protein
MILAYPKTPNAVPHEAGRERHQAQKWCLHLVIEWEPISQTLQAAVAYHSKQF